MASLTKRQREIYEMIRDFIRRNDYAPSLEEIRRHVGLSSVATVHKHLKNLEARGVVRRQKNRSRSIGLTGEADSAWAASLPLLGEVAAGAPIEAIQDPHEVSVPGEFVGKKETYVLRVRGDSMIDEQIRDGDLIVVERRRTAENGQTVVALVDGGEATVKKLRRQGSRVRLEPANEKIKPMIYPAKRVEIQGVVVGLLRKYR